jgi:thiol-disulfide isomerase/thioredoxin
LYLLVYTLGLCLALFVVAIIGQKIMSGLGAVSDPHGLVKKSFGVLFILVGVAVLTGFATKIQTNIAGSVFDVTKIEQKLLSLDATSTTSILPTNTSDNLETIAEKNKKYPYEKEISTPDGFINTDGKPITLAELKDKVVLLDIWTYSCINCRRTLPYIESWYEKYKDQGFVVVGLHTPEFSFEKVQSNVEKAVKELGLTYPIVMDNDFSTWNAYGNQYWPRKYLIDIDGYVIYDHIGEGGYEETEKAIQYALEERTKKLGMSDDVPTGFVQNKSENLNVGSPETYFGASRNEYLANGNTQTVGMQNFIIPKEINPNSLYLEGLWNITPEYAETKSEAQVVFKYYSKNIYMVASSPEPIDVSVYQDGVFIKKVTIKDDKLYSLIEGQNSEIHTLLLKIPKADLKAFTFTFG